MLLLGISSELNIISDMPIFSFNNLHAFFPFEKHFIFRLWQTNFYGHFNSSYEAAALPDCWS